MEIHVPENHACKIQGFSQWEGSETGKPTKTRTTHCLHDSPFSRRYWSLCAWETLLRSLLLLMSLWSEEKPKAKHREIQTLFFLTLISALVWLYSRDKKCWFGSFAMTRCKQLCFQKLCQSQRSCVLKCHPAVYANIIWGLSVEQLQIELHTRDRDFPVTADVMTAPLYLLHVKCLQQPAFLFAVHGKNLRWGTERERETHTHTEREREREEEDEEERQGEFEERDREMRGERLRKREREREKRNTERVLGSMSQSGSGSVGVRVKEGRWVVSFVMVETSFFRYILTPRSFWSQSKSFFSLKKSRMFVSVVTFQGLNPSLDAQISLYREPRLIWTWIIWISSQLEVLWKSHVDLSSVNLPAWFKICPNQRIFTWYYLFELSGRYL